MAEVFPRLALLEVGKREQEDQDRLGVAQNVELQHGAAHDEKDQERQRIVARIAPENAVEDEQVDECRGYVPCEIVGNDAFA